MSHPLHRVASVPPPWMRIEGFPLADLLEAEIPWSVSRWGDGEWYALLGYPGQNSDRQPYHPGLGEALRNILLSRPAYYLGMRFPDQPELVRDVPHWLQEQGLADLGWTDAGLAFHNLVIAGRLPLLLDALRLRPLIVVGPPHLRPLERWVRPLSFVEVPLRDAWTTVDAIHGQVAQALEGIDEVATVAISAGITAKVLVDRLWRDYPGRHYLWDLGAVFDPFCGVNTRRYHRRPEFRRVVQQTLAQLNAHET